MRSFDYRDAGAGGAWGGGVTRTIPVSGVAGVPSVGVAAVAVAVSVVAPTANGYVTVWPSGSAMPLATAVNFVAGQTKTNLVKVPVDASGSISVFNFAGTTGITTDVVGFFVDESGTFTHNQSFQSVTPVRVLDTRPTPVAGGGSVDAVVVGGSTGVPATASAVEIQVEAVNPSAAGYLTVWATGSTRPVVSNVLFGKGQTIVTSAIAPVGAGGKISIFTNVPTDVVVDICGYYDAGAAGRFHAINTTRLFDTRSAGGTKFGQGQTRSIPVAGVTVQAGTPAVSVTPVPVDATAVVFAATAVNNSSASFLTFWPGNQGQPLAAMLLPNAPWQLTDNLIVSGIGSGGIKAYNHGGTSDVVIDVNGYYTGGVLPPAQSSINGTVTQATIPTATPAAGVTVTAYPIVGAGTPVASTTTGPTGTYTLTVPPGSYYVCFDGSAVGATGLTNECYNGHQGLFRPPIVDATTVNAGSAPTTGIDALLSVGGTITGHVTAAANGANLAGVLITAYQEWYCGMGASVPTGCGLSVIQSGFAPVAQTTTAADGTYVLKGVPVDPWGVYVCFDGSAATGGPATTGYNPECYDNVPGSPEGFGGLFVLTGAVGVDAALDSGGSVAGRVTGVGGVALPGVTVSLVGPGVTFTAVTAANGTYQIGGLPEGNSYTVCFDATAVDTGSVTGYLNECYNNIAWGWKLPRPVGVTALTVGSVPVTGIDAALAPSGGLKGLVTDPSGAGVAGVTVYLVRPSDTSYSSEAVRTGADGTYLIGGVSAGSYRVCFRALDAPGTVAFPGGLMDECHADLAFDGWNFRADATSVSVSAGAWTTVNAGLSGYGSISGTATMSSGAAAPMVEVLAYRSTTSQVVRSTWTDASGHYLLGTLPLGQSYVVCFDGSGVSPECHNNVAWSSPGPTPVGTTAVALTQAAPNAVVDVVLAPASVATVAGIKGTVTDSGGAGLSSVYVQAFTGAGQLVNSAWTDAVGAYQLTGLTPGGAYYVCFEGGSASGSSKTGYAPECFNNVPWSGLTPLPGGLTPVSVPASGFATANAALANAPGITGTVTGGGYPLSDVGVTAYDSASRRYWAQTAADGTYSLGLRPGAYTLCFHGGGARPTNPSGYINECYNNVVWPDLGYDPPAGTTPVTVTTSIVTVNADLAVGGVIKGKVTDSAATPNPLAFVNVTAYSNGLPAAWGTSTWDGSYTLTGLAGLPYVVCFADPRMGGSSTTGYLSECYNNAPNDGTLAGATPVTPTPGGAPTTVNAALSSAGGIVGLVTDPSGQPLPLVDVSVADAATGNYFDGATTGADGVYRVRGLPTGSYEVCFNGGSGPSAGSYLKECFDNQPTTGTPTPVAVTAGSTATANAVLAAAGGIAGTVVEPAGALVGGLSVRVFDSLGVNVATTWIISDRSYYSVSGLAPGTYRVCLSAAYASGGSSTGYLSECYNNVVWNDSSGPPAGAANVSVAAGAYTTGVNFTLDPAPGITGRLTTSAGTGIVGARVEIFNPSVGTYSIASTTTDANGYYGLRLNAGTYSVCFDGTSATGPAATGYISQCHSGVPWNPGVGALPAGTTSVTVPTNGRTTVNATLSQGAAFTGVVSSDLPAGTVAYVSVDAYDLAGNRVATATTGGSTPYTLSGLPTGSYKLSFWANGFLGQLPAGGFQSEFFNNAIDLSSATPVSTTVGAATVVNASLAPLGAITGTVTDSAGNGVQNVYLHIYDAVTGSLKSYWTATNAAGSFTAIGLATGTYTVCFDARSALGGSSATGYLSECYLDVAYPTPGTIPAGTTSVSVNATTAATTVNAALAAKP
ncbi:MAG: carboxypeptidase-like regulatory domain-containing protein [Candidatus Phosphoribacter baldrii]